MSYNDEAILTDNIAHKMAMAYKSKIETLNVNTLQQDTVDVGDTSETKNTAAKYLVKIISFLKQLLYLDNRFSKIKQNKDQINNYITTLTNDLASLNLPEYNDIDIVGTYKGHFNRDYKKYVDKQLNLISLIMSQPDILPSSSLQTSIDLLQLLNNIVA